MFTIPVEVFALPHIYIKFKCQLIITSALHHDIVNKIGLLGTYKLNLGIPK